jgi:hypothetical protein
VQGLPLEGLQPCTYAALEPQLHTCKPSPLSWQAARPATRVHITMQGEMGATVFLHPAAWQEVGVRLRARVESGKGDGSTVNVGIGLNNNKLCGCINIEIIDGNIGSFVALCGH